MEYRIVQKGSQYKIQELTKSGIFFWKKPFWKDCGYFLHPSDMIATTEWYSRLEDAEREIDRKVLETRYEYERKHGKEIIVKEYKIEVDNG